MENSRKKPNQLVLDEKAEDEGYKIGDIYQIDSDELKEKEYTITGFVRSPLFINNLGEDTRTSEMVASIILSICLNPLLKQIFILSYILILQT